MTTPEDGIRRTITQYAHLCDDGRFAEWADLFDLSARFHVMGTTHHGRSHIWAFIEAAMPPKARGRHANLGSVIDVSADGVSAQAWTDYVFLDRDGKVTSIGRYHDELAQYDDERWRFTLREIVFLGGRPELAQPTPGD